MSCIELFVHKDSHVCVVFFYRGWYLRKTQNTPRSISMCFRIRMRFKESNLRLVHVVVFQLRSTADRGLAPGV